MADQPPKATAVKGTPQLHRGNQPGRKSVYSQAVELQDTIMAASRNKETTPSALAQLARAWSELEERKRILRMKPKPKDVDVSPEALRRRTDNLKSASVSMIADAPALVATSSPNTNGSIHTKPATSSPLDLPDLDPSAD